LLLYLQIFSVNLAMRYSVYGGILLNFLIYWVHVPLETYYCAPHRGQKWEELLVNGMPQRLVPWGIGQGALAVVLDIYIFALPIRTIAGLNLNKKKKLQVMSVFITASMYNIQHYELVLSLTGLVGLSRV
jgi:hypothetical protein